VVFIFSSLKKVTEELQEFVKLEEQWIKVYTEIELERSSSYQTIYFDLHPSQAIDVKSLWDTVKRQVRIIGYLALTRNFMVIKCQQCQ